MKQLLAITLSLLMMLTLASCSAKEKETMDENTTETGQEEITTPATTTPAPATTTPAPATTTPALTPTSTTAPTAIPTPIETTDEVAYTGKKLVALTFDDGPNLNTTPLILDRLEANGVVASFFLIGKNISETTKPVMERELELGCEIANHSWSHSYMNQLSVEEIKKEIEDTGNLIYDMVGVTPEFFRPPYIVTSPEMYANIDLPFINGINCTDWDATVTTEQRVDTILKNVKDGDIILLHDFDDNTNTVNALDGIIQGLLEDGYAFVTISKLFELEGIDPDVENKIWTNTHW